MASVLYQKPWIVSQSVAIKISAGRYIYYLCAMHCELATGCGVAKLIGNSTILSCMSNWEFPLDFTYIYISLVTW